MPIYVYKLSGGGTLEVFQKADDEPFGVAREIPPEQIIAYHDCEQAAIEEYEEVERVPAAPGGFQGLPTPRFYK
jgi:hypothetical protein